MPICATMTELEPAVAPHSVLGDGSAIALVSPYAVIDFLCWPDFSDPTLFAALESPEHGFFSLAPVLPDAAVSQTYMPDANALITQWNGVHASAKVIDILLPKTNPDRMPARLIRRATAIESHVTFTLLCRPRPNGGQEIPRTENIRNSVAFQSRSLPDLVLGRHDALRSGDGEAYAEFTLKPGASAVFILSTRAAVEYHTSKKLEQIVDMALAKITNLQDAITTPR